MINCQRSFVKNLSFSVVCLRWHPERTIIVTLDTLILRGGPVSSNTDGPMQPTWNGIERRAGDTPFLSELTRRHNDIAEERVKVVLERTRLAEQHDRTMKMFMEAVAKINASLHQPEKLDRPENDET